MGIEPKNKVMRDSEGRIIYKQYSKKGHRHYNIEIWLDGQDSELKTIRSVEYILHKSFKNRNRISNKPEENFKISIWTWGIFPMGINIYYNNDTSKKIKYYLRYSVLSDDPKNFIKIN